MIAGLLGAGAIADAFLVAFQFVNVVRRLLSEGALNAALVPAWMKLRETLGRGCGGELRGRRARHHQRGLDRRGRAARPVMPLVVTALAPGFAGHDTLQLAVTDARLMLPYLAFAGPATVLLALASAQGRFFVTAFSPLLFNLALIAVMVALIVARTGRRALPRWRWRRPSASPACCSSWCWRSAAAKTSQRRCASPSTPRCAASSPARFPA